MSGALRLVAKLSYFVGLLSLVLGALLRFVPALKGALEVSPRGALGLAAVLFLCALVSWAAAREGD